MLGTHHPGMAEDVRVYGELIEFMRQFKCEACQTRDRKCLIQKNDGRCMLCTDADRQCVFTRTVRTKGPRSAFEWESLLGQETTVPIEIMARLDNHHRPTNGVNGSTKTHGQPERGPPPERGRPERPPTYHGGHFTQPYPIDLTRSAGSTPLRGRDLPPIVGPGPHSSMYPVQGPPFHPRILPALGPRPLMPAVKPQDFDREPPIKRSRSLEPEGKEHAAKVQRTGACTDCKNRKLKCHHEEGEGNGDEHREDSVTEMYQNASTPDPKQGTPTSQGKTPNSGKNGTNPKPYVCLEPDCPRIAGFSTRNDLDRHKRSVHRISSDSRYTTAYKCAGINCAKPDKIWPRLDNFRSHCERMHGKEDINALLRRSEIDPITEEPIYRASVGLPMSLDASQVESAELMSAYEASIQGSRMTSPMSSSNIPMSTSDSSVTCSICGLELKGKAIWLSGNLMRHIREKHTSIHRLRKCDLCGKQFSRNHNLYLHLSQVHQVSRADADAHISRESTGTLDIKATPPVHATEIARPLGPDPDISRMYEKRNGEDRNDNDSKSESEEPLAKVMEKVKAKEASSKNQQMEGEDQEGTDSGENGSAPQQTVTPPHTGKSGDDHEEENGASD